MKLYNSKIIDNSFTNTKVRLKNLLKSYGYSVTSEMNIHKELRKLDIKHRKYVVIGVSRPSFIYELLRMDDKIGTLLPFNILLQEINPNTVEILIVNVEFTLASLKSVHVNDLATVINEELNEILESL